MDLIKMLLQTRLLLFYRLGSRDWVVECAKGFYHKTWAHEKALGGTSRKTVSKSTQAISQIQITKHIHLTNQELLMSYVTPGGGKGDTPRGWACIRGSRCFAAGEKSCAV